MSLVQWEPYSREQLPIAISPKSGAEVTRRCMTEDVGRRPVTWRWHMENCLTHTALRASSISEALRQEWDK
jgi:hypothetical protein